MKNLIFLLSFLIHGCFCPGVFAAVTVIDGGSPKQAERISAPNRQLSKLADKSYLIETGNGNFLVNPDFEVQPNVSYPVLPGWDLDIDAVHASQTTYLNSGSRGASITAGSATHTENRILFSGFATTGKDWVGQNLEASIYIKNLNSYTGWKFCAERYSAAMALESKSCVDVVSNDTNLRKYSVNIPGGSTTSQYSMSIYKNGVVPGGSPQTLYVDNAYFGLATNIGSGTPPNTFTAQVAANSGGTAAVSARTGVTDWISNCTVSSGAFTCPTKSGLFTQVPNCTATAVGTTRVIHYTLGSSSASQVVFTEQNPGVGQANDIGFSISCTKTDSDYVQPAITPPNYNYKLTSWTPTTQGFGTLANTSCLHARVDSFLKVLCRFDVGTVTATEARITLPNNLVIASSVTAKRTALGYLGRAETTSAPLYSVMMLGGTNYVTFGAMNAGSAANLLTNMNGNAISGNGVTYVVSFEVPIEGWDSTQSAPQLVGSVTSNSNNALRIETLATLNCGSNPCTTSTTTGTQGWFSSVTRNSTGNYTVNFNSGVFSAPPICFGNPLTGSGASNSTIAIDTSTTSGQTVYTRTAGALADVTWLLTCIGPR